MRRFVLLVTVLVPTASWEFPKAEAEALSNLLKQHLGDWAEIRSLAFDDG